jgi:hypothetical protein
MKIRRTELEELLKIVKSGSKVVAQPFALALYKNTQKVVKRLEESRDYSRNLYLKLKSAAEKADSKFDIVAAEKMIDSFRDDILPKLTEKYSWYGDGDNKMQYLVQGNPNIHQSNIIAYNKEAEKEYNKVEAKVAKKYPKELALLREVSEKSEVYMNKETTIGFLMLEEKDIPSSFSMEDIDTFSFMINIVDDEEA